MIYLLLVITQTSHIVQISLYIYFLLNKYFRVRTLITCYFKSDSRRKMNDNKFQEQLF